MRGTNSKNYGNRLKVLFLGAVGGRGAMRLKSLNSQKAHLWPPSSLHSEFQLPS